MENEFASFSDFIAWIIQLVSYNSSFQKDLEDIKRIECDVLRGTGCPWFLFKTL